MKKLLAISTAVVCLAGCDLAGSTGTAPFYYAGIWNGTWADRTRPDGGTISITIDQDGAATGTFNRDSDSSAGDFTGQVSGAGDLVGAVDFTVDDFALSGTVTKVSSELRGNFTYTYRGETYSGTFTVN